MKVNEIQLSTPVTLNAQSVCEPLRYGHQSMLETAPVVDRTKASSPMCMSYGVVPPLARGQASKSLGNVWDFVVGVRGDIVGVLVGVTGVGIAFIRGCRMVWISARSRAPTTRKMLEAYRG